MAAPVPAKECATLGYLQMPVYSDGTSLRDVTACAGVNVDTLGVNAIHGISQALATGAAVTGILTVTNMTLQVAPELTWVRVGNGIVLNVIATGVEINGVNAGVGTAAFAISSTGAFSDLFVASGANTQFPLRASYSTFDTAGNSVNVKISVIPPPTADPVNTILQIVWTPLVAAAGQVLTAAQTFKYDVASYF